MNKPSKGRDGGYGLGANSLISSATIRTNRWWASAGITGPALPNGKVSIRSARSDVTSIEIGPATEKDLSSWARPVGEPPEPSAPESGFQVHPLRVAVFGRHVVRWEFQATDEEHAHQLVEQELIPELAMSLNLLGPDTYRLELRWIGQHVLAGGSTMRGPWHGVVFQLTRPRELPRESVDQLAANMSLLAGNPTLRKVSQLFHAGAHARSLFQDEPAFMASALLQFHLAVEAVVSELGGRATGKGRLAEDHARIVEELQQVLSSDSQLQGSVKAIRRASDALRRVEHAGYRTRLAACSSRLELGEDLHRRLREFYRFRNEYLGHADQLLDEATARRWMNEAHELAWTVTASFARFASTDETIRHAATS